MGKLSQPMKNWTRKVLDSKLKVAKVLWNKFYEANTTIMESTDGFQNDHSDLKSNDQKQNYRMILTISASKNFNFGRWSHTDIQIKPASATSSIHPTELALANWNLIFHWWQPHQNKPFVHWLKQFGKILDTRSHSLSHVGAAISP